MRGVFDAGPSHPHASIEGEPRTLALTPGELGSDSEDLIDLKSESDLIDLDPAEDSKITEMAPITEQMALYGKQVAADDSGESKITIGSNDTTLVAEPEPSFPMAAESSPPVVTEAPLQTPVESSSAVGAGPSAPVMVPTAEAKTEGKSREPSLMEARIQAGFVPRVCPRKIGASGDFVLAGRVGESQVIHVVTPIERFLWRVKTKTSDGYRFIPQEPDRYVLEKGDKKETGTATTEVKDGVTDNSGGEPRQEGVTELNNKSSQTTTSQHQYDNEATNLTDEASQPGDEANQVNVTTEANNEIFQLDTAHPEHGVSLIDLTDSDSQTDSSPPDEVTLTTSQVVDNEYFPEEPPTNTQDAQKALAYRNPFDTFPPPPTRDSSGNTKYNYQSYFEIKESPVGGLGAFAVKDLYKGDIILMEAPILRTNGFDLFKDFRALDKDTREIFLSLHAVEEDGVNKIGRIRRANAFEIPSGIAILAIGSRFNHGCNGKRSVSYIYDAHRNVMVFEIVAEYVPAGQELFVTYGGTPAQLFRTFGFRCQCGGCDGLRDEDIRRLRAEERGETYRPTTGRMRTRYGNDCGYGTGTRYHGGDRYDW